MMRIPFGSLPSMSALFLDYAGNSDRVRPFYPQGFSLESICAFAKERQPLEPRHREELCSALAGLHERWGIDCAPIEKLAAGAVVVITGQQPGLFTGPYYTILKAITVIKLAKALSQAGVPAVPVFWVAAEDHDYQEIEGTSILDTDSALRDLRVNLSNSDSSPVGWLKLGADVEQAVSGCLENLPKSGFQSDMRSILASYHPGASPVDAFARMMGRLFDRTDLIFVDPLDDGIRKFAVPTLHEAVKSNAEIRSAVISRSRALSAAGYHEQVKVDDKFTGLFAYRGKSRKPLPPAELTVEEPLSANVLLRPAMQDAIFPTVAYAGGPAEIAYFAQAAAVYQALGRRVPPVFPRISATVLESRVSRALRKYEMEFLDVLRGRDAMRRKAVAAVQGVEAFDTVHERIKQELESLRPVLNAVDPTLEGALDNSRQKILHQVEAVRTKFVNAEARRNETLERQLEMVANSIFPYKKLQERVTNVTSFLARYGPGFIPRFEEVLSLDSTEHQIIEI